MASQILFTVSSISLMVVLLFSCVSMVLTTNLQVAQSSSARPDTIATSAKKIATFIILTLVGEAEETRQIIIIIIVMKRKRNNLQIEH